MLSAGSAAGKQSQDFSLNTANGAPVAPPPATSNKLNNIPPETAEATAGNAFKTAAVPAIGVSTAAAPMADQESSQNNAEQLMSIDDVVKSG